jgi:hypothetical protein
MLKGYQVVVKQTSSSRLSGFEGLAEKDTYPKSLFSPSIMVAGELPKVTF